MQLSAAGTLMCELQACRSKSWKVMIQTQNQWSAFTVLKTCVYQTHHQAVLSDSLRVLGMANLLSSMKTSQREGEPPSWFVWAWGLEVSHLWSSGSLATVVKIGSGPQQRSRIHLLEKSAMLRRSTRPTSGIGSLRNYGSPRRTNRRIWIVCNPAHTSYKGNN